MKVFRSYGSKERLFEMMERVNHIKLNEEKLSNDKRSAVIVEFIGFVFEKLGMDGDLPEITISYDSNEAKDMMSFGKCTPSLGKVRVVGANRNLADILRTLGHELVHYKQFKDGRLKSNSSETGSEHENEANSLAGIFLREFGQMNPIIFE